MLCIYKTVLQIFIYNPAVWIERGCKLICRAKLCKKEAHRLVKGILEPQNIEENIQDFENISIPSNDCEFHNLVFNDSSYNEVEFNNPQIRDS